MSYIEANRKTLEFMLQWTAQVQPGRNFLQTSFRKEDMKNLGCYEDKGRYFYQLRHDNQCSLFEILPRKKA